MTPSDQEIFQFSSSPELACDVFISFRGADIRNSFASHLFGALKDTGNTIFRDDEDIKLGDNIREKLRKAIKDSRLSIVVFSKDYAASKWCLFELVEITRRKIEENLVVMPVFFHVEPREVRSPQKEGIYKNAFDEYKKPPYDQKEVDRWECALKTVGSTSGSSDLKNKSEKDVIEKIVKQVWGHLMKGRADNGLMDIYSRVKELPWNVKEEGRAHILGIHGKEGIGKTTIARVAYDRPSPKFDHKFFLENVNEVFENHREHAAVLLRNQILSAILKKQEMKVSNVDKGNGMIRNVLQKKKVLIILDDVKHENQLENLFGDLVKDLVGPEWKDSQSTIVVTTESEVLLDAIGAQKYRVPELSRHLSAELFYRKAFMNKPPEEDCDDKLKAGFVDCGKQLPLAIEVLGSTFRNITKYRWSEELKKLNNIEDILRAGYVKLDILEKDIFLDIACFFKGRNFHDVKKILAICYSEEDATIAANIEALHYKSLIKVSEDKLWMHDKLKSMGQEIGTSSQSRLWEYEKVKHVLRSNDQEKSAVQSIVLDLPNYENIRLDGTGFRGMSSLRLLKVKLHKVDFSEEPTSLPDGLRYLEWHYYPSESLPPKTTFKDLKFINLSHSEHLTQINFTTIPEVKELNLEGCTSLLEILPEGDICHEKLIYWNMKDCEMLESPAKRTFQMESLQELVLSGCSELKHLPDISGNMNNSLKIYVDGTKIQKIPNSIDKSKVVWE